MSAPRISVDGMGVVAVLAAGLLAYVGWRAYKAGAGVADSITEAAASAGAFVGQAVQTVGSAVANATGGQPPEGDPLRKLLYSDAGYTGNNADGSPVLSAPWFSRDDLRRYEAETRGAYEAAGRPAPVVSNNGAAFGIYPRP